MVIVPWQLTGYFKDVKLGTTNEQEKWLKSVVSPFSTWRFLSREQTKSECDWVVMLLVFVASQSSCFFLCLRKQIRL